MRSINIKKYNYLKHFTFLPPLPFAPHIKLQTLAKIKDRKGLDNPISYQQSETINYIGGWDSQEYCRQQIINIQEPPSLTCRKSDDITKFSGIEQRRYHFVNIQMDSIFDEN